MSVLTGLCPDLACGKRLYFPSDATSRIECTNCGQAHDKQYLINVTPVTNPTAAIQSLLQSIIVKSIPEQFAKTSDSVKVQGLSNYCCKLISPLLTKYGLDRNTQEVKLLKTMGQGNVFDCTHLSDRAFRIESKKLDITGYGRDKNACEYLSDTLQEISKMNNNEESLIPLHADGDGHCLLHAVSRVLVGHELFWHPLMTNLKLHLIERCDDYKGLFGDFFEDSDWDQIIQEADPNFIPSNGETHGLCNIHIFGLANVLHRAIILIDSLEGMQSKGDYSAVFVPALISEEKCRDKNQMLHQPIVISWSSKGRNHFVPLVGIKEKNLPQFPFSLLPKLWGLPQELIYKYVEFDNGACTIGGGKTISDQYLLKLVASMEKHFQILNGVTPSIVQDVYQFIVKPNDVVNATTQMVIEIARELVNGERLYKCLLCKAVVEIPDPCPRSWLDPGGQLYQIAVEAHQELKDGFQYRFPQNNNILCSYNKTKDKLLFIQDINKIKCKHCQGSMRLLNRDGSIVYINGDQLTTPASEHSKCGCGLKHFWNGKEYDNLPKKIPVNLEWEGRTEQDTIYWFQDEVDVSLNSNAYELAQAVVQKHFPGKFGSERLVQNVVDQIFRVTLMEKPEQKSQRNQTSASNVQQVTPTKIILTGAKSKTLHKEELTASVSEQVLQKKIEHGAAKQKRLSSSPTKPEPVKLEMIANPPDIKPAQPKSNEQKIRISRANSKDNEVFILTDNTTFLDLQLFITEKFNVQSNQQMIKFGFPPKTLQIPIDTTEKLNLKHGERLVVHEIKITPETSDSSNNQLSMDVDQEKENKINVSTTSSTSDTPLNSEVADKITQLLKTFDLWEWASVQRHLFQTGGLFYKQAFRDLGQLSDKQHFSLPCFPNKLFSYDKLQNEILVCLGENHITVQPLSQEQLIIANQQHAIGMKGHQEVAPSQQKQTNSRSYSVTRKASPEPKTTIFSGVGHSMLDVPENEVSNNTANDAINAETVKGEETSVTNENENKIES